MEKISNSVYVLHLSSSSIFVNENKIEEAGAIYNHIMWVHFPLFRCMNSTLFSPPFSPFPKSCANDPVCCGFEIREEELPDADTLRRPFPSSGVWGDREIVHLVSEDIISLSNEKM